MARKESITITDILNTAFALTREEGIAGVTARNVAKKAGCSTQPIFRVYHSMEELWRAVYEKAVSFFEDYYEFYPKMGDTPFLNFGMAYISFAREEKNLFKLLFKPHKLHVGKLHLICKIAAYLNTFSVLVPSLCSLLVCQLTGQMM